MLKFVVYAIPVAAVSVVAVQKFVRGSKKKAAEIVNGGTAISPNAVPRIEKWILAIKADSDTWSNIVVARTHNKEHWSKEYSSLPSCEVIVAGEYDNVGIAENVLRQLNSREHGFRFGEGGEVVLDCVIAPQVRQVAMDWNTPC